MTVISAGRYKKGVVHSAEPTKTHNLLKVIPFHYMLSEMHNTI